MPFVPSAGVAGHVATGAKHTAASERFSSEESRRLEIFQLQNNQGPRLDCVRTGTVVTSADLESDRAR